MIGYMDEPEDLEQFWLQHGWYITRVSATEEHKEWCYDQFGYFKTTWIKDRPVLLFREEQHRTQYLLAWGQGEDRTIFWHPV